MFVYGLLFALLANVAVGGETWPFSSFRLFSQSRNARVTSYELFAVGPSGEEFAVDFALAPEGLRYSQRLLPRLARSEAEAEESFAAIAQELLPFGTSRVRVYRVVRTGPWHGRSAVLRRELIREIDL